MLDLNVSRGSFCVDFACLHRIQTSQFPPSLKHMKTDVGHCPLCVSRTCPGRIPAFEPVNLGKDYSMLRFVDFVECNSLKLILFTLLI